MDEIQIVSIENASGLKKFIKYPFTLYKQDPLWVPHLLLERYRMFNQDKNPFFKHADMKMFLAKKGKKIVGRIAAIVNYRHIEYHNEKVGFFGFFECQEDYEVAKALLDAAREYLKGKGMTVMRGPMNPSTNDEVGFLMKGFDSPPVAMMVYNPPYYLKFMERYGMIKAKDLYAFKVDKNQLILNEKLKRVTQLIKKKNNIKIRKIRMDDFDNEIKRIKEIYNDAWSLNWGFIPMTGEEFDHLAADMKQIVEPELVLIAEKDGEPAGFSLAMPNVNEVLIKIRNGRLFPTGIFKLLLYRNSIKGLRVITLGVKKKFEHLGLGGFFYLETVERGIKMGYTWAEASWILEDNQRMIRPIQQLGGKLYKEYRIFETFI